MTSYAMVEPGHTPGEMVASAVTVGVLLVVGVVVFYVGPKVAAALTVIRSEEKPAEVPEEFDTQARTGERDDLFDVAEATDDFAAWESECASRPRIARYVAKLEERAS